MIVAVSWHIHDEYAMNVECELKVDEAEMEFAVFWEPTLYKNLFYKNVEAEIHPDVKNMLRTYQTWD